MSQSPRSRRARPSLEDQSIAFGRARRFRDEQQSAYRCLYVEPTLADAPTVQIWFQVRLDDSGGVGALLSRIDAVLQAHPAIHKKEGSDA